MKTIILFQLFFILFALFAIVSVHKRKKDQSLGTKGAFFWTCFWLCSALFVIWPESTSIVAEKFGLGRGADLILYSSVAIIFFMLFRMHIKIEALNRTITKVTRDTALQKESQKKL